MRFPDTTNCEKPGEFALTYAEAGIPVFPVAMIEKASGGYSKKPHSMLNGAPRGEGGYKLASADVEVVAGWWVNDPQAAIGWYPGAIELAVIDADGPSGVRGLYDASAGELDNTTTLQVRTSGKGGGRHVVFDRTGIDGVIRNGSLSGVLGEARADRGYGMLPDGTGYYTFDSDTLDVAKLPKWAYEILPWSTNGDGRASIDDVTSEDEQRWMQAHTADRHSRNGQALIDWCIAKLEDSDVGVAETGRYPTMTSVVGKILSHAQAASGRDLDLTAAFTDLRTAYLSRFDTQDEHKARSAGFSRFWSDAVALRFKEGDHPDSPFNDSRAAEYGEDSDSSSWSEIDMSTIDPDKIPEPSILFRDDLQPILYPGVRNVLFGPSESAKSWFAAHAIQQTADSMESGDLGGTRKAAVVIDFEDIPEVWKYRLRLLGMNDDVINRRIAYHRPIDPPLDGEIGSQLGVNLEQAKLIVVDSMNESAYVLGLSPSGGEDIGIWRQQFLRPIEANLGSDDPAAILVIDHTGHDQNLARVAAIGSYTKLTGVRGVQIRAHVIDKPAPGRHGAIALFVAKDTNGKVREISRSDPDGKDYLGTFMLDPLSDASDRVIASIVNPGLESEEDTDEEYAAIIDLFIQHDSERGLAMTQIEQLTVGKMILAAAKKRLLVKKAVEDGHLETFPAGVGVRYRLSETLLEQGMKHSSEIPTNEPPKTSSEPATNDTTDEQETQTALGLTVVRRTPDDSRQPHSSENVVQSISLDGRLDDKSDELPNPW
jgi:hypothetical protein